MANWYLNRFLTTYRQAVDKKYPKRGKRSDGSIGNAAHRLEVSEHNRDIDGSVDAWDMDVNLLGSSNETGTAAEKKEVRKVIAEFERQPQAYLWIYNFHIATREDNWRARWYGGWSQGRNPHDKHAHLQSRSSQETRPYKGDMVVNAINVSHNKPTAKSKPVPSFLLKRGSKGTLVKKLQDGMNRVFPVYSRLTEDGDYGPKTEAVIKEFQKRANLKVDGIVGSNTKAKLASFGVRL
jgi:peptidoglycan hydrolase-like protein with peptidoglycan-binding domain